MYDWAAWLPREQAQAALSRPYDDWFLCRLPGLKDPSHISYHTRLAGSVQDPMFRQNATGPEVCEPPI